MYSKVAQIEKMHQLIHQMLLSSFNSMMGAYRYYLFNAMFLYPRHTLTNLAIHVMYLRKCKWQDMQFIVSDMSEHLAAMAYQYPLFWMGMP